MNRFFCATILAFAFAAAPAAQSAVFVVRHAERADSGAPSGAASSMMAADPDLSDAGRRRAAALAAMLRDAKISAIYVTEFKRTRQTAEPLARRLGIEMTVVASKDSAALVEKLKGASGNVLVVGHSNTVPVTLAALGVREKVTLGETDYDNLFLVVRAAEPQLLQLHFP